MKGVEKENKGKKKVTERANMITNHIEDADNEFMADKMRTRVAKLLG